MSPPCVATCRKQVLPICLGLLWQDFIRSNCAQLWICSKFFFPETKTTFCCSKLKSATSRRSWPWPERPSTSTTRRSRSFTSSLRRTPGQVRKASLASDFLALTSLWLNGAVVVAKWLERRSHNLEFPSSNPPGPRAFFLFFHQWQNVLNQVVPQEIPSLFFL